MAELKDFMFIFRYEPIENYQKTGAHLLAELPDKQNS